MKTQAILYAATLGTLAVLALGGCGIATYPGQPGFTTNNYAKIDIEYLDEAGLFFYEVTYDNRPNGAGVGAIVTKLYPGAKTYTSNLRTNADGTLFRTKTQYDGAKIQMIAMPKLNQISVAPDSEVQFLLDYEDSLDEVDDTNLAEKGIFKAGPALARWTTRAYDRLVERIQLLKSATLSRDGSLSYTVTEAKFGAEAFKLSSPVTVKTTFNLNAVKAELTKENRKELAAFLESKFPKGFKGDVELKVKGSATLLTFHLGVHTINTARAAGMNIVSTRSAEEMEQTLASVSGGSR